MPAAPVVFSITTVCPSDCAHALAHDARQRVGRTAGRERHHQGDRPRRIGLRLRLRGANPDDAAERGEQNSHP